MKNNSLILFLSSRKKSFIISALIYFVFMIIGMLLAKHANYVIHYKQIPWFEIFLHNMYIAIVLVFIGWLTFGVSNSVSLAINSLLFGTVLTGVFNRYGFSAVEKVILPHAGIEIFATIIFSTLGYEVYYFIASLKGKKTYHIKNIVWLFLLGIILMLISAIIEGGENL